MDRNTLNGLHCPYYKLRWEWAANEGWPSFICHLQYTCEAKKQPIEFIWQGCYLLASTKFTLQFVVQRNGFRCNSLCNETICVAKIGATEKFISPVLLSLPLPD